MTSERINCEMASKIANILSSQKFSSDIMAKRLQAYKFLERYLLLNLPDIVRAAYAECPDYFKYNNVMIRYNTNTDGCQLYEAYDCWTNIPVKGNCIKLPNAESDVLNSIMDDLWVLKRRRCGFYNEFKRMLIKLSTYEQIKEEFPGAYELLIKFGMVSLN
jgi:hypothetical protein